MATWDRYKSNITGLEITPQKGARFTPRFYNFDTTGTIWSDTLPVAVLSLSPLVQYANTNIAWDVSQSVSGSDTINTFDLTFGGGGATDLTAQDWSVDPTSGNVQYTTPGTYTVTLYVTDTTNGNRSSAAKQQVTIIDEADEDIATANTASKVYIATADDGIYTYVSGAAPAAANTGLSGGDLNVASGRLHPAYAGLAAGSQHYWMCNDNGLAYSVDGCDTYTKITKATLGDPLNAAGDATPPDTDDLDEITVAFDPRDLRRVYLLRLTDSTWNASNSPRAFIYFTDDYGGTWQSRGVGTSGNFDLVLSANGAGRDALAVSQSGDNVFVALEDDSGGDQIVFNYDAATEFVPITGCGGIGFELNADDWSPRGTGDLTADGSSRVLTATEHPSNGIWYISFQVGKPERALRLWDSCDNMPGGCTGTASERMIVNISSVSVTPTSTAAARCTAGSKGIVWNQAGAPPSGDQEISWMEVLYSASFTMTLTISEAS